MHRAYTTVVGPVIEAVRPSAIAEVGAGRGLLTRQLVRAPGAARADIHAIDLDPGFTVEGIGDGLQRVTVHAGDAGAALRAIGPVSLVLVDGDPNWHSVAETLDRATTVARDAGAPVPVFVIHNVHWPFGRRDGYHRPEAVPASARHEHAADGLAPTSLTPLPEGLRYAPYVAIREYGDRNGVLTAIEDFFASDGEAWQIVDVPGFGGTAVLMTAARAAAEPALRTLLQTLRSPETLKRAARRAESGRLTAAADAVRELPVSTVTPAVDDAAARCDAALAALAAATSERDVLAARVAELELAPPAGVVDELRQRVRDLDAEVRVLLEHRARHEAAIWRVEALERDLAKRESERIDAVAARDRQLAAVGELLARVERLTSELADGRAALASGRDAHARAEAELGTTAERLREVAESERLLSGRILHLEDMLQAARLEAAEAADARVRTVDALNEARVDAAEVAIALRAVAQGRRSRAARAIRRGARRALFRSPQPSALDRAVSLIERRPELPEVGAQLDYAPEAVPMPQKDH